MLDLNTDIIKISRVGEATARRLKRIGIMTVSDLLFYFPFRHDNFSEITLIENLKSGGSFNVVGEIELIQNKRSSRKRMYITEALVKDETDSIKIVWFNQPFIGRNLKVGDTVSFSGKVSEDYSGYSMVSPVYEKNYKTNNALHTQGLVPNYRLTADITQKQIRFLISQVIKLSDNIIDWMPEEVTKKTGLIGLSEALRKIHFPKMAEDVDRARRRLSFDELFLVQMRSQLTKNSLEKEKAETIKFFEKETKNFVEGLSFKLTDAQRKTSWEIIRDIGRDKPMARLLEGDVGSGKTIVAAIAILNTVLNKKQAVLMAPTEILARQHYESFCKMFSSTKARIGLITRSDCRASFLLEEKKKKISKNKIKNLIANGEFDIIIGTHALIQDDVIFCDLALVVVDEQHRFGVEQRKTIIKKSGNKKTSPHLLSMTATPIPRSLALAIYGDLNISIIDEMPKDRKKIITNIVSEEKRSGAYRFIKDEINKGKQVFVICPLIDFSDALGVKSVKEEFDKLKKSVFPDFKIGMLHGKMKSKEKEEVMQDFIDNKINILVSTSVVEVGVDIPNAGIMLIEGADRFGLAQLHQFRGRVGRSDHQSYCFLFTESEAPKTLERLNALTRYNDGFSLAKIDLKFRGPGEVYGTMQKGFPELKIASLFDYELMKLAKTEAERIVKKDFLLKNYPELKEKIGEWERTVHLE